MGKKIVNKINSFEECDQALKELALATFDLEKNEAEMNERIQAVKEEYENKTAASRGKKEDLEQQIEAFSLINKPEFNKLRTKELIYGWIGFRTNPPKVAQLNRKYSVQTSVELLKKIFKKKYLREKTEMDKEKILADYAIKKLTDEKLASVGLKVDQDDAFYYDINRDKISSEAA